MANRAANDAEAVPFIARFISEPAQEFRALGGQGKCNRNPCHAERGETSLIIDREPSRNNLRFFDFAQNDRVSGETVNPISLLFRDLHDEALLFCCSRDR